ncbi:E3 ubiquitin-protein ligase rnf213-alpha [Pelomyxa schiedti]|nr:E3 ubiquitin-protein ligase rnf213-alpha [Pelomyxa schiedti]
MRLIGACNPYLVRSPEQIMRMESNGLGFSSRNCTTICNIPVRHLIYRVNPLPPQMLELVWDFGSLDLNSESSYIKCIITKSAENMDCRKYRFTTENAACLANVFSAAQQAMRGRNDDLGFVSLRDVHRATQVFWYFMRFESDRCPNLSNRLASLCEMQRYEPVSNFIRASILALFVAYETRLDNSDVFRSIVCKALKIQIGHYTREIKLMLDLFSSSLELSPGIARNTALIENFFMMVVAIELRLPLFIVGKPGTSKSLAKAVLKANLNGKFSPSPFFTPFPDIRVISFQCSPQTTSERLVETFAKAIHLQGDDNIMNTKYVVFLDEVGLAEDSTHLPLKVLHMLLDSEKYKSVSVVGISNWALDPAKMNRALWHTVRVPDIDELILTARRICSAFSPSVGQRMGEVIVPVARAYLKVYNKMQPNTSEYRSDFFGLRDYYSLLKMMCSWLHRHPDSQALPQEEIDLLVRRSFSATESTSLILNIFYEELSLQVPATPFPSSCDGGSLPLNAKRTLDCIVQCLQGDSRFLLLMSDASLSCLDILFEKDILVRSNCEVIYGSCFPKDQEYAQVCQDISRIKTCMEVGRTVVLVRSMHIYESLYDLLNQYWIQWAGHRFTELGLGNERVQCRVDPEFRVVIAAERSSVLQDFPVPLVNRLEKHYLSVETMLSEEQHKIVDKLRYLLDVMNSQGHLVVGFRTLAHLKALIGTLDHKDINYVTKLLLQMMSPESVLQSGNKEWIIWYFNCQYLHSFYDLVVTPSFTDRKNNLLVITTHSEAFPVQLFQKNVTNAHVHLVEEFKTSSEVAASIQSILSCDGIGIFVANFPFVSVDMVLQVQHLIENGTSSASGKKFYIVVHYPRAPLEGQTSLVRRGWMQVHIDTLFPEQFFFPQPCVSFEEPSLFNIMEKHALWGVVTVSCVAGVYARISQKKIALDPPQEMNVLTKLLTADKGFIEFFLSLVKKYLKEWESKNTSLPRTWLDSVAGDIALVSRHVTLLSASQQCAITQCEEVCAPIVEFLRESSGLFLYDEGTSCIKQLWIELGKCLLPLASTLDPSLVSSHSGEFPFSWAICTLLEQLWEVSEQTSPNCVEQTLQTQFELCLRNSALLTEKFSESAFALRQAYIKDSLHFMYRYIVGISQTAEITRAEFDWGLILLRDALTHEATDADTLPHMFIVVHKTLHLLRAEFTILHVITEVEPQTIAQLPCEFSKGELLRVMLKAIASKNFAETSRYFVTQRIRPLVLDVLLANSSETRDKCHNYWLSSEVSAIYWFHFQNKDTVFIETICSILKQQDSICRKIISALGAHIHHLAELKPEKNERDKFYRTGGAVVIDIVNTLLHDHFLLENDQAILLALVELINTLVTNQNTVGFCSELLYFLVQVSNNKNWAIHSQITTLLSNVDYSSVIQNALFCLVQKQKVESMCKQSLLVIQHFYSSQVTVFTVAVERLILQISGEMAMANPSSLSEPQVRLLDYTARYCVMHSDVDNIYRKLFLMKVIVRKFGKDALLAAASQHQQRFPWMKQMIECDSHYLFSAPTKVFSVYGENYSRLVRGLQSLTLTPPDLRDTPTILSLFSDEHQNSNRLVRCIESSNYPPLVKNFAIRLCTRCFTPTPPLFPPSATKIHSSILMLVLHVGAVVSKPTSSLIAPLSVLFSTPHVTVNLYIPTMPHDEAYASVMATAMGTHGVFRCNSCGAYVIVGECGKPMATAKCTCGQLVGGSNHTPVPNMKAVHNFVDTSARGFDPDSQVPVTRGHSQLQLTLLRILIIATLLAAQLSGYTLISSSSKLCGVLENLISLAVRTLGISPEDIILLLHLVLKRLSMIANVASEFEWKTAKGRDTWEDFVIQTCISPELENPTNSLRAATLLISKSSATQSPLSCALQETSTSLQITDENGKFLSVQPLSLWRYRATPSFEALCNHVQQLTSTGHTTHSGLIYMCTKYRQLLVLRYLPSVLKVRKQVESLHASWKRNPSTTISDLAQTHNIPTRKHIRNVYRAFQAMYAFFPHYLPASFLQSVSSSIKNEWNPDYLSDTASVDRFAPALCERGVACTALILAMVGLQNEFIGVMSRSPQRHTPIPHSPVPLELVTEYHIVSFKFSTLRDLVFKCSDIGMNYGEGDQVTWDLDCAERCLSNSIEAGKRPLCGQLGTHSSPYGRNTYQQGVIKAVQTIRETIKPQERIGTHIGGSILNSLFTYCTIPSSLKAIETALCFLRVTGSTISPATTTPDSTLLSSYFVETLKVPTEDPLVRLCDGRQLTFHHLSSLWGLVDLASTFSVINACSTAPHSELSRIAFPHVSPAYREQMSKGVQLDLNTFMHGSCVDLISILTELRELALFKFEVGGEYETPTNSALKEWITTYIEEEKQTSTGHLGAGFTAFPQSIRVTHILHCWTTIALYVAPTSIPSTNHH